MPTVLLTALLAIWFAVCLATYLSGTDFAFLVAYRYLPFSGPFVLFTVSVLGQRLARSNISARREIATPMSLAAMSYLLAACSLLASSIVIDRLLEIPWRSMKFGPLDLRRAAPYEFAGLATFVLAVGTALFRQEKIGRYPTMAIVAAFAMMVFSTILLVAACVSPLVIWRD